jgi:hypothetical protein
MKFSTEAIVAVAVAVVFVLLSFCAIAREGRDGHNPYIAANNVSLSEVASGETGIPRLY